MSTKKAEPTGSASKKTRRAYAFFLPGSCASTTAASIRAQPKYSRPLRRSPKIAAPEMVANTDSRLSSREITVGLEPF